MSVGGRTKQAIDAFLELLMTEGVAADYVSTVKFSIANITRITWDGALAHIFAFECTELREYLECVERRQYSALLRDGSLLQITYDVDKFDQLEGHRLVYWPSPLISLDLLEDFPTDGVAEVIGQLGAEAQKDSSKLRLRSPWRFDFDPRRATPNHPETHLTTMHSECRLPVTRPLDLRRFGGLVFKHLHTSRYDTCDEWTEEVPRLPKSASLTRVDDRLLHVHWRSTY